MKVFDMIILLSFAVDAKIGRIMPVKRYADPRTEEYLYLDNYQNCSRENDGYLYFISYRSIDMLNNKNQITASRESMLDIGYNSVFNDVNSKDWSCTDPISSQIGINNDRHYKIFERTVVPESFKDIDDSLDVNLSKENLLLNEAGCVCMSQSKGLFGSIYIYCSRLMNYIISLALYLADFFVDFILNLTEKTILLVLLSVVYLSVYLIIPRNFTSVILKDRDQVKVLWIKSLHKMSWGRKIKFSLSRPKDAYGLRNT